jgi:hypothetical protein
MIVFEIILSTVGALITLAVFFIALLASVVIGLDKQNKRSQIATPAVGRDAHFPGWPATHD